MLSIQQVEKSIYVKDFLLKSICVLIMQSFTRIRGKNNAARLDASSVVSVLQNLETVINGSNNCISIAEGARISKSKIEIQGSDNQVIINQQCRLSHSYLWVEDRNCKLVIGESTTLGKEVKICVTEPHSKISIGNDCMLAYGTIVRSGDSHSIIDLASNKRVNYAEDVTIGSHVWIGTNAQVLKGVYIGKGSIVAAGAIVT